VRSTTQSARWAPSVDNSAFELLWVHIDSRVFVAAFYHPPKPVYSQVEVMNYIELCAEEINRDFPFADIVLAGDFNQLLDQEIIARTGLTQLVHQPTRGTSVLDRVYVSNQQLYPIIRVVSSIVRSDHKAVVAYPGGTKYAQPKIKTRRKLRLRTPAQHAEFLKHVADMDFSYQESELENVQNVADSFYCQAYELLERFYPEREVVMTSRDPEYITPAIKVMLRRKNKLMRAGRVEEAGALAKRIGSDITSQCKGHLSKNGGKMDVKKIWDAVRKLTGRQQEFPDIDSINAESLNNHYATISTDLTYTAPSSKQSAVCAISESEYVTEYQVFEALDKLRPSATGLDEIPTWFLRLGAPIFAKPVAQLFNCSIRHSVVPQQWKRARIRPIPKVCMPNQHTDFRPISITPVLTRVMERTVVKTFLYPAILSPPVELNFADQYAFRPTGSTEAAIIRLLQTITNLLLTNPYVTVISLDFSKAFDTVRHSTLLEKISLLDIPDHVYNWIVDFFSKHSHCTAYRGQVSTEKTITASIVQGSGVGPASYVIAAGDLKVVNDINSLIKYADDTYLIIPACAHDTRLAEIDNVKEWALSNNLTLNTSKTKEIVFQNPKLRQKATPPASLPGIVRETSLKVLGVTLTQNLSASEHVRGVISNCSQTLYALRVLRNSGMCQAALQEIFRSVAVARLMYASSAWNGFITETDRKRVDAFLNRAKKCGFCSPELQTFSEMVNEADQRLFYNMRYNSHHVLHELLPPISVASQNYELRTRAHNREIPCRAGSLSDSNFITRMMYTDCY